MIDDFDRPIEPWEQEDMDLLAAALHERPLGGHIRALDRPHAAARATGRFGSYETEESALEAGRTH